ncbi:MAG: RNA polymerase sigma factor [Gemmatimonadaceae bacterium]|nr:RNA polymerase sigma factor [Gemmatimonadaceae bacterium]
MLAGNVEAYALLFRRYRDDYTRFAVRMLGSYADADDALQSAFLRAYRALAQCHDPDKFGAWLRQIVVNECRTAAVRRGRRDRRFAVDEGALERVLTDHPADGAAMREEIQHALDQLEVEHREAFLLKHVEGLSYEEMSAATGVGVSALKMRVKRACDRLRELLDGVHHD